MEFVSCLFVFFEKEDAFFNQFFHQGECYSTSEDHCTYNCGSGRALSSLRKYLLLTESQKNLTQSNLCRLQIIKAYKSGYLNLCCLNFDYSVLNLCLGLWLSPLTLVPSTFSGKEERKVLVTISKDDNLQYKQCR